MLLNWNEHVMVLMALMAAPGARGGFDCIRWETCIGLTVTKAVQPEEVPEAAAHHRYLR